MEEEKMENVELSRSTSDWQQRNDMSTYTKRSFVVGSPVPWPGQSLLIPASRGQRLKRNDCEEVIVATINDRSSAATHTSGPRLIFLLLGYSSPCRATGLLVGRVNRVK